MEERKHIPLIGVSHPPRNLTDSPARHVETLFLR